MPREEYSGRQSSCFLDSVFLFCQKKSCSLGASGQLNEGRDLLPFIQTRCCTGCIAIREEWMVCLLLDCFFLSSTRVSLISGHQLTGPSVNQSPEMITVAMLRSQTLWQFICMTAGNETVDYSLQWKIHFLISKQSPQNSKVVLLRILGGLYYFYKWRYCFYFIFCWDCFLLTLKSAKPTATKEESRCEKSRGRNRHNKITELSGPVCLYNVSYTRKELKEFVCDMVSARTIALFHHCCDAKSPAKPSKTLIKQIWALHRILATAGRFIKKKSKHQLSVVLAELF